jgi:addiction module HigA family antidote
MREVAYPSPGEILLEEFLKPMGISQYRLAKAIGVPQRRIGEIVAGKRAITADTGLRLSRFFGLSDQFWTGLQLDHGAALAREALGERLTQIQPWAGALPVRGRVGGAAVPAPPLTCQEPEGPPYGPPEVALHLRAAATSLQRAAGLLEARDGVEPAPPSFQR